MGFSLEAVPNVARLFLIIYVIVAVLFAVGFIVEKIECNDKGEQLELKAIVSYSLILGVLSSGCTLGLTVLVVIGGFFTNREVPLTVSDVGISMPIMFIVTILGAVVLPVLFLAGALALKALFIAVVFLGAHLIVKPLEAWGNFLNRVTGYAPKEEDEDENEPSPTATPKE